jgi:DNA-binding transcriptional regulator YhcF (GntR family)
MANIFKFIDIDNHKKSKNKAIINGIIEAIDRGVLVKGALLPSVNKMIQKLGVARMTVVKALKELKERGIIVSENKVGYFVADDKKSELKVFLMLTEFSSFQEILYDQIIEDIRNHNIKIDLFFHHCNPEILKTVLYENLGLYGLYVITVFDSPIVKTALSRIPARKLLQVIRPPLFDNVSSIGQDFYLGLKETLKNIKHLLAKYEKFILIFSEKYRHPGSIKIAFTEFCKENNFKSQIEKRIKKDLIVKGTAFCVIQDNDLIALIRLSEEAGFQIGNEIGILSYNDIPMKEFIRNGITTISVDFAKLGQAISDYIKKPTMTHKVFEPELIIRKSL